MLFRPRPKKSRTAHILVGLLVAVVGFFLISSASGFSKISEPALLYVQSLDSKYDDDGVKLFRPSFETTHPDGRKIEYTGNVWVSPKPHNAGETVPGRVDWKSGRMKSDKMIAHGNWLGWMLFAIGSSSVFFGILGIRVYS